MWGAENNSSSNLVYYMALQDKHASHHLQGPSWDSWIHLIRASEAGACAGLAQFPQGDTWTTPSHSTPNSHGPWDIKEVQPVTQGGPSCHRHMVPNRSWSSRSEPCTAHTWLSTLVLCYQVHHKTHTSGFPSRAMPGPGSHPVKTSAIVQAICANLLH